LISADDNRVTFKSSADLSFGSNTPVSRCFRDVGYAPNSYQNGAMLRMTRSANRDQKCKQKDRHAAVSPISDQVFDQAAAITFKFSTRTDMQTTCRCLTPMTQSDSHNSSFSS
jgi:hypothetical protein